MGDFAYIYVLFQGGVRIVQQNDELWAGWSRFDPQLGKIIIFLTFICQLNK
jgi:hypothetical protein